MYGRAGDQPAHLFGYIVHCVPFNLKQARAMEREALSGCFTASASLNVIAVFHPPIALEVRPTYTS